MNKTNSSSDPADANLCWNNFREKCQVQPDLPIARHFERLIQLIEKEQVIIIAGETGSGKTTQVPKACVLAGRGKKRIMVTQPRRLAAIRTAERIAEECSCKLGQEIGYHIRFNEMRCRDTIIEVMTDGIPLAGNLRNSPFKGYDTVIIDEVHERSTNIDILLGLLKLELQHNRRLKVLLMSATPDINIYQAHFPDATLFEVEGRTFPVEISYRHDNSNGEDTVEATCSAVSECLGNRADIGDILCFLPTERDIIDCEIKMKGRWSDRRQILPLYSRLPHAEQNRVFQSGSLPKIILSTNIAETSLTLPGVRTVIDSGYARVMRYQPNRQVARLELERISIASATQRAGRAGRVAPGRCIRLYSPEAFDSFEPFTHPEIRRTDLSLVVLKLVSMGISSPSDFPFPECPQPKSIQVALKILEFLGAVRNVQGRLETTPLGQKMSHWPLAPRLSHMLIHAEGLSMVPATACIAAFLSIQDPRLAPAADLDKARLKHRQWQVEASDFLGIVLLFKQWLDQNDRLSSNQLNKWCKEQYLSRRRMGEWQSLAQEFCKLDAKKLTAGLKHVDQTDLHKLILGSHLDHIFKLDPNLKKAKKDSRAAPPLFQSPDRGPVDVHPSSSLRNSRPEWGVCTEYLHTSKCFALNAGVIDPVWIEDLNPPGLNRHRGPPFWDPESLKVVSEEKVSFRNFHIRTVAKKDHFPVDPEESTALFIHHVLILGELDHPDIRPWRQLVRDLQSLDGASRQRGVYCDEHRLLPLFREHIGLCSRFSDLRKKNWNSIPSWRQVVGEEDAKDLDRRTPLRLITPSQQIPIIYFHKPNDSWDGATLDLRGLTHQAFRLFQLQLAIPAFLETHLKIAWQFMPTIWNKPADSLQWFGQIKSLMEKSQLTLHEALIKWLHHLTEGLIDPDPWLRLIADQIPGYTKIKVIDDHHAEPILAENFVGKTSIHSPIQTDVISAWNQKIWRIPLTQANLDDFITWLAKWISSDFLQTFSLQQTSGEVTVQVGGLNIHQGVLCSDLFRHESEALERSAEALGQCLTPIIAERFTFTPSFSKILPNFGLKQETFQPECLLACTTDAFRTILNNRSPCKRLSEVVAGILYAWQQLQNIIKQIHRCKIMAGGLRSHMDAEYELSEIFYRLSDGARPQPNRIFKEGEMIRLELNSLESFMILRAREGRFFQEQYGNWQRLLKSSNRHEKTGLLQDGTSLRYILFAKGTHALNAHSFSEYQAILDKETALVEKKRACYERAELLLWRMLDHLHHKDEEKLLQRRREKLEEIKLDYPDILSRKIGAEDYCQRLEKLDKIWNRPGMAAKSPLRKPTVALPTTAAEPQLDLDLAGALRKAWKAKRNK